VPKPDVLVFMKMAVLADHHPKVLFVTPIRHRPLPSRGEIPEVISLKPCLSSLVPHAVRTTRRASM
jgi:hypothetical protein